MNTRIKRVTAGLLSLSMCATAIPLTAFADNTVETPSMQSAQTMTYTDMLEQLSVIEDCFNAPYFMVSEGDSVYIDGEKIATTTVEVDRELAFSDSKKLYEHIGKDTQAYKNLTQHSVNI